MTRHLVALLAALLVGGLTLTALSRRLRDTGCPA